METESARLIRSAARRRLAIVTAPAVLAVLAVAMLLSGCATGAHPAAARPTAQVTSGTPPYYVTILLGNYLAPVAAPQAVVRNSATGKVTGTVPLPAVSPPGQEVLITAAANDLSFVIAAGTGSQAHRAFGLFRLSLRAHRRGSTATR